MRKVEVQARVRKNERAAVEAGWRSEIRWLWRYIQQHDPQLARHIERYYWHADPHQTVMSMAVGTY